MPIRSKPIPTLILLGLCLLLLGPALVFSEEIDLLFYELSDLHSGESENLERFRGKPTVLLIFEPGCRYCARQSRILNSMLAECKNIQVVGIGVHGSRRRLREDLALLNPQFPAFMAGSEFLHDMGDIEITPVMLIANAKGYYDLHLLGLQSRDKLTGILNPLSGNCPI